MRVVLAFGLVALVASAHAQQPLVFKDAGDDSVFVGFGVLDGEGVVVVHHDDGVAGGPDVQQSLINNLSE